MLSVARGKVSEGVDFGMFITNFYQSFPSELSIRAFHQTFPSDLSIRPFHQTFPSDLSIRPFHQTFPSDLSIRPFYQSFPSCLFIFFIRSFDTCSSGLCVHRKKAWFHSIGSYVIQLMSLRYLLTLDLLILYSLFSLSQHIL